MEIKDVPIKDIKPYKKNSKKHNDLQIEHIKNSLDVFDWLQPCVIDENKEIIIGHGRYLAAKLAGHETVPCYTVTGWSKDKKRAARIADNSTNQETGFDLDILTSELNDIFDFDMNSLFGDFGIDDYEIDYIDYEEIGDGGGSRLSPSGKIKVIIGSLFFYIEDENKELLEKTKIINEDILAQEIKFLLLRL